MLKYRLKPKLSIMRYYATALIIAIGTFIFGMLLIRNTNNVVERVVLFPEGTSDIIGGIMIFLSTLKQLTVFRPNSKIKKYALMGITLCWLTITWAYLINQSQNTGSVMSIMITMICYLELWRGDYSD